jgi:hypothetical protein
MLVGMSAAEGPPLSLPQQIGCLEQHFGVRLAPLLSATGGRFHAARLHGDTLILDAALSRWALRPDVSPFAFEPATPEGRRGTVLVVEGDSRHHPFPPFTDLDWWMLEDWPDGDWSALPAAPQGTPPSLPALRPRRHVFQLQPPEAPAPAPPASATEWAAFLVASGVLALLTALGMRAVLWSLPGGWLLVWALPGLFVLAVGLTGLARQLASLRRRPSGLAPALDQLAVTCDAQFTVGDPFGVTVQAARLGDHPLPPLVMARVVQYTIPGHEGTALAGANAAPVSAGLHVTYGVTVHAERRLADRVDWDDAALWALELVDGSEPYVRILLPSPHPPCPLPLVYRPDRATQISMLLAGCGDELILKAYNGPSASSGLARHGEAVYHDDFTKAECRAVFTVSIQEVATAAWERGWLATVLQVGPVAREGTRHLVFDEGEYRVVDTERFWQPVVYASPEAREALEGFLVRQPWAPWLAGTEGLLDARTAPGLVDHPQAH